MTIENIGKTYLDINATVSKQQDIMSLIEVEVTQALRIFFINPPKSLINTPNMQIVSKHPHLFAGKDNEASLFFALRIVAQQHRRKREQLRQRVKREGKLAKNLEKVRQSKEFLDLVSKKKILQKAKSRGH